MSQAHPSLLIDIFGSFKSGSSKSDVTLATPATSSTAPMHQNSKTVKVEVTNESKQRVKEEKKPSVKTDRAQNPQVNILKSGTLQAITKVSREDDNFKFKQFLDKGPGDGDEALFRQHNTVSRKTISSHVPPITPTNDSDDDIVMDDIPIHKPTKRISVSGTQTASRTTPLTELELHEEIKQLNEEIKRIRQLRTKERKQLSLLKTKLKNEEVGTNKLRQDVQDANGALAHQAIKHTAKEQSLNNQLLAHKNQVDNTAQQQSRQFNDLRIRHKAELQKLRQFHAAAINSLEQNHASRTLTLRDQLTSKTTILSTLEKENTQLRGELEQTRTKLKTHEIDVTRMLLAEKEKEAIQLKEKLQQLVPPKPLPSPVESSSTVKAEPAADSVHGLLL